jgi:hypothetical protein
MNATRRITVEMVRAAKERHPEIALERCVWVRAVPELLAGPGITCLACPTGLLAIDAGAKLPTDSPPYILKGIIEGILHLDPEYLDGFVDGFDGEDMVHRPGRTREGYEDGRAVAAAFGEGGPV